MLTRHLAQAGYAVHGGFLSDPPDGQKQWLAGAHRCDVTVEDDLARTLRQARPDVIFYLAGQSSVGASFDRPVETWASCAMGLVTMLAMLHARPEVRVVLAGSGECFGETALDRPATEASPLRPNSPYAAAKCAAHHAMAAARATGRHMSTAFLFSHESPLRSERFVLGKVTAAARRIAQGSPERLTLGDLQLVRDWGWAAEYVVALHRMSELTEPGDFVIATGHSYSLGFMVERIFAALNLDWTAYVDIGAVPPRPATVNVQHADPAKAERMLDWKAHRHGADLAQALALGG